MVDSIDEITPENKGAAEYKPKKRNAEQSKLAGFRQKVKNLAFEISTEGDSLKHNQLHNLIWEAITGEFKSQVHEVVSIAKRYSEHLDPEFVELIERTSDQVSETMAERQKAKST